MELNTDSIKMIWEKLQQGESEYWLSECGDESERGILLTKDELQAILQNLKS